MQYDTIIINGSEFPRPVGFAPELEDVYINEYTTVHGKLVADYGGRKYKDMTLSWEALPEEKVIDLVNLPYTFELEFDSADGYDITEQVRRISTVAKRHRYTINGVKYWKDVSVSVGFLNTHKE